MVRLIQKLDAILRGQTTRPDALRDGRVDVPVAGMTWVIILLGMIYGACMGLFSITRGGSGDARQLLAAVLKIPALFLGTLLVTLPSLYVFNTLIGSRLILPTVLRLLVAALSVMLAVLASIGPIVGFFSFTTTSYPFMLLLNVAVCGIAGFCGLAFLLQTLHRLTLAMRVPPLPPIARIMSAAAATTEDSGETERPTQRLLAAVKGEKRDAEMQEPVDEPGPLDGPADHASAPQVRFVFGIWVVVFALVGTQMAWVLRPFLGRHGAAFAWFMPPGSNFYQAVFDAIRELAR